MENVDLKLTAKEMAEIGAASNGDLLAIIRVTGWWLGAPLFVGDRARAKAIKEVAGEELYKRQTANGQVI